MTKRKILLSTTLTLLTCSLIGGLFALSLNDKSPTFESLPSEIISNGIKVKALSETNQSGGTIKTFAYSIEPSDATNQDVKISLSFTSGGDCEEYVTAIVNENEKEITVTCHQAFDEVIDLVITSTDNPSVSATVKINYTKKVLSSKIDTSIFSGNKVNLVSTYSIFTKDTDYTYTVDVQDLGFEYPNYNKYPEQVAAIESMYEEVLESQGNKPTEADWVNKVVKGNNEFLNVLINEKYWGYMDLYVTYTITVNETNQVFSYDNTVLVLSDGYDFSSYRIPVSNIETSPSIDF